MDYMIDPKMVMSIIAGIILFVLAARFLESRLMRWSINRAIKKNARQIVERLPLFMSVLIFLTLSACGGGSSHVTPNPPPTVTPVSISLTPSTATLIPQAKQNFIGQVVMSDGSTSTSGVNYTASGNGSIDSNGVFTAGATSGGASVQATSGSLAAEASVQIVAPSSPTPTWVQSVACGVGLPNGCVLTSDGRRYVRMVFIF